MVRAIYTKMTTDLPTLRGNSRLKMWISREFSMRVVEKIRGLCKITFCAIILRHTPDLITPMMKSRSLDMSGSSGTRN